MPVSKKGGLPIGRQESIKLVPVRGPNKYGKSKVQRVKNLSISTVSNNDGKSEKSKLRAAVNYARRHFGKEPKDLVSNEQFAKIYIKYEKSLETLTRLDAMQKAIVSSFRY